MVNKNFILWIFVIFLVSISGVSAWNFEGDNVKIISPIEDGFLPVIIQDQHTEIIDLKMGRLLDTIILLDNYSIGDRVILIETTGVIPTIDDTICLKEGTAFYQARPVNVVSLGGNQFNITMDTPLDYAFTTSGGCSLTSTNLAVDGSVTPITFKITPSGLNDDVSWDITRFILLFGGDGIGAQNDAPDDGDFGVTTALTNGVVIRSVDGITKNLFNAKTNGDFRARAYDMTYTDISKSNLYTVATRRSFSGPDKNGVTIRLNAITNDSLEFIVQDDLTEMSGGQMIVQGHVVQK